ncbi:hypothetical protein ACFC96_12125 [Streptomyces sp. NPDC055955]|uniref:hypothetical protein n=1 Tax=Streptomyces sp. NPDC055955 TaxID=3345665 RepID=UPI0035DE9E8E
MIRQTGGARSPRTLTIPASAQTLRARRKVNADGRITVEGKRLRIGRTHAGRIVTILFEDTCYRVLDGDTELSTHPRTDDRRVTPRALHRTEAMATAPIPARAPADSVGPDDGGLGARGAGAEQDFMHRESARPSDLGGRRQVAAGHEMPFAAVDFFAWVVTAGVLPGSRCRFD